MGVQGFVLLLPFSLINYIFSMENDQPLLISRQYQATGRGFVVRHIKFSENYRLYSRSHFVKGYSLSLSLSLTTRLFVCGADVICIYWFIIFRFA